jgi:hypothetical protein
MIFTTYNGATLALLLAHPNWAQQPVKVELSVPWAEITEARSGAEDRQPYGESARYTLEYTVDTFSARESSDLRAWLMRLRDEQVAVPMWADYVESAGAFNAGATSIPLSHGPPVNHGAIWIILSPDRSIYEIVSRLSVTASNITLALGCTLNWPAGTRLFPLLFGHIPNEDRPKFKNDTAELISGVIKVRESSPFNRRLSPFDPGGSQICGSGVPAFITTPLFNIRPHHSDPIDTTEVDLLLVELGFTREKSAYAGPYAAPRGIEHTFLQMSRDEIAAVNWFFVNRQGPTLRFMAPTFMGNLRLTQDLPISGNTSLITIEASRYTDPDYSTNPGAPFLALNDPDHITAVHVTSIDIDGLHTAAPIGTNYKFTETKLSHLLLCRFADAKLTWTYDFDALASCKLRFIEVPNEYNDPPVEKGPVAYFLRFTEVVDVPVVLGQYTSYEKSIFAWDDSWPPAPFSLAILKETLDLSDTLAFSTFDFDEISGVITSNPLRKILEGTLEGKLYCEVLRVNPNDPETGAVNVITGEVMNFEVTGKEWKAVIDPFAGALDRDVPHFYKQKVCNVPIYSQYCRLDRETFRADGTLPTNWENNKVLDISGGAGLSGKPADYFSPGYIETGTGPTLERRTILASTPIGGGQRITLARSLLKAADLQAVKIYPVCNGSIQDCGNGVIGRFNNYLNHKGHPNSPRKNPSADIPDTQMEAGGKKG